MRLVLTVGPLDFTDHQRSVFCVFSGTGVSGLRRHLTTGSEFAEYLDNTRPPRRRSTVAHGTETTPGPMLDMDGIDEADGVEDDDMGDGSEIALDPGNFNQPADDNNDVMFNQVPPPPPFHHPPALDPGNPHPVTSIPAHPVPMFLSYAGVVTPPPIDGSTNAALPNGVNTTTSPQGSLEQVITTTPASTATTGAPVPSRAGASIFGNASPAAGPSTASLQGPPQEEEGQGTNRT